MNPPCGVRAVAVVWRHEQTDRFAVPSEAPQRCELRTRTGGASLNPMPVLVCFALKEEAGPFQKIAAGKPDIVVRIVGIGRENAQKSVRDFLKVNSAELVLTCGFAGGLDPELKLGDVVFDPQGSDQQSNPGKQKASAWADWQRRLVGTGAKPAKFLCVDHIATTAAEKKKLRAATGADAVEMESAAIQAVCRERGIPCVTVRVISDTAEEDLPLDFNALAKPDKSLDLAKLAWTVARSPGKIGALLELQKKTSLAARQLAGVLEKVISA